MVETDSAEDWPVEWQPVEGTEDGFSARLHARLVLGFLALATRLPESAFRGLVGTLARVARRIDHRHADAARRFLVQALGEQSREELEGRVLQAYRHFLRVLMEPARFARRVPERDLLDHFDVRWTDEVRRILAQKTGCLLVTPHLGNWEMSCWVATRIGFSPVYAVAKPVKNRLLSIHAQAERESRGVRLLPRRGAMADSPKVIRAGGTIGLLLDQRARKRPVLAPFFGRPARCDRSAGVLMKRLRVPVVIGSCFLTDEPLKYRLEFEECLQPDELAGADPVELAKRVNQAFERLILRHPEQYFWLHDRFKDTPTAFEDDTNGAQPGSAPADLAQSGSPAADEGPTDDAPLTTTKEARQA